MIDRRHCRQWTFTKYSGYTRKADKSAMGTINRPLQPGGGPPLVPIYHGHTTGWWPVGRDSSPPRLHLAADTLNPQGGDL